MIQVQYKEDGWFINRKIACNYKYQGVTLEKIAVSSQYIIHQMRLVIILKLNICFLCQYYCRVINIMCINIGLWWGNNPPTGKSRIVRWYVVSVALDWKGVNARPHGTFTWEVTCRFNDDVISISIRGLGINSIILQGSKVPGVTSQRVKRMSI